MRGQPTASGANTSNTEDDTVESDLWALGSHAHRLLNAFAMRRMLGKYGQDSLDMMARKLSKFGGQYA